MKKITSMICAIALALTLVFAPVNAQAATAKSVYFTVEKLTIGQGLLVQPMKVEIKDGDTVQTVFEKAMKDAGYEYTADNSYGFYLTGIKKADSGKILKEYLERSADFWMVFGDEIIINPRYDYPTCAYHNYDMVDGIEYVIKASNPYGEKIIAMKYQGRDIREDDEFTLVINSYRASGSGGYEMISEAETVREIQTDFVDALAEYIMEREVIDFDRVDNIEVIR